MLAFGSSSFAVLGVLYALLTVLLLTSWRGRRVGVYLIVACLASVVWSGAHALELAGENIPRELLFVIEVLRSGAWIAFLAHAGLARNIRYAANGIWLLVLASGCWVVASNRYLGTAGNLEAVAIHGGLIVSLVGLVIIEQIYRNASPTLRSSTKALAIGLGGVFAYDLFLYSLGVLFNEIDPAIWLARGAVNILFVPMIALAVKRNPDWDLNIFVSRKIVFYSTTLVAVGLYLLLVSVGGYLLLIYGGAWGQLARVLFFAASGVALVALLFSDVLRAKLRVFLSKHFFQNKYDYRDEWLRLVATLAEFEDSSTRRVVIRAMAQIVDSPAGVLWTRASTDENFVVAATYETDDEAIDIDADSSLVQFIEKRGWIVDLNEFRQHPQRYDDLELPDWLRENSEAWLIVPLTFRSDVFGLVLLDASPGRPELNYEDRDLLKTVGNHIAVHLAQETSDSLLAQAQQFDAYNRLTAFLMHDLKNLIAQQSLIVENAERHKTNPEFVDDMVETISGGVQRMRRVIDHLRQTSIEPAVERIELGKLVLQVVSKCQDRDPAPRSDVPDEQIWVTAVRDRLAMALDHAIRNAQDATPADGTVEVTLSEKGGRARICVTDTGAGMDRAFVRDRLFKPFDSTKGTQGVGIGAYQIRETIRSAGGTVAINSEPGEGTELIIILNVAPQKM